MEGPHFPGVEVLRLSDPSVTRDRGMGDTRGPHVPQALSVPRDRDIKKCL